MSAVYLIARTLTTLLYHNMVLATRVDYCEQTTHVSSRPWTYGGHGNDPHCPSTKYM